MKDSVTQQEVIDFLNELLVVDPQAVTNFVIHKTRCNSNMENHPTLIVSDLPKEGKGVVGFGVIGFINGLFGLREDGRGPICYDMSPTGVTKFGKTPSSSQESE